YCGWSSTLRSNLTSVPSTFVTFTSTPYVSPASLSVQRVVAPTSPLRSSGQSTDSGARPTCFSSWAEISFANSSLSTETLLPAEKEQAAAAATAAAAHTTEPKSRRIPAPPIACTFAEQLWH